MGRVFESGIFLFALDPSILTSTVDWTARTEIGDDVLQVGFKLEPVDQLHDVVPEFVGDC